MNPPDLVKKKLSDLILKLQVENAKLTQENIQTRVNINDLSSLKTENLSLKEQIANLKEEKVISLKENAKNLERVELKYIKEVSRLKSELQTDKIENYNRLEAYVKYLESNNEELTVNVNDLKEGHKNNLKLEQERNKLQCDEVKRKTLTFLATVKKNASTFAYDNLNNSTKLTLLQMKQFKHEMEFQSNMIEELLSKVTSQEKLIKSLKLDLETQRELESALTTHNKKLSEMIKEMVKKMNSRKSNAEDVIMPSSDFTIWPNNRSEMKQPFSVTAKSFYKSNIDDRSTRNPSMNTLTKKIIKPKISIYKIKTASNKFRNTKIKTILDSYEKQINSETRISFIGSTIR